MNPSQNHQKKMYYKIFVEDFLNFNFFKKEI